MPRQLRNGKSHETLEESKKKSYKKSLKSIVVDIEPVVVDVPVDESENEQELDSLRFIKNSSNQNISVLPSTSTKRNLSDDSFENEPSSESNLFYNKKK